MHQNIQDKEQLQTCYLVKASVGHYALNTILRPISAYGFPCSSLRIRLSVLMIVTLQSTTTSKPRLCRNTLSMTHEKTEEQTQILRNNWISENCILSYNGVAVFIEIKYPLDDGCDSMEETHCIHRREYSFLFIKFPHTARIPWD